MPSINIDRSLHNCLIFGLNFDSDIDISLLDYPEWQQRRDKYQLLYPKWQQMKEELLTGCLTGRSVTFFLSGTFSDISDRQPGERVLEYDLVWPRRSSWFFSLFHEKHTVSIVQVDQCSEETVLQVIRWSEYFNIGMTSISSSIPFSDRETVEKVAFAHMSDGDTSASSPSVLECELISCYDDGLTLHWSNPGCGMNELYRRITGYTTTQTDWDIDV